MLYWIFQVCCLHIQFMILTKLLCCNNCTSLHSWGLMLYLSAHMTHEQNNLFGERITVCLCQCCSFKWSARKLSVTDAFRGTVHIWKRTGWAISGILFKMDFFFSSNGHKIGKIFWSRHIFQVNYQFELFSSFYFGLSNTLPWILYNL